MTDPPLPSAHPHSNGDTGTGSDQEPTTGTPAWVKVFGIIALILFVLFVVLHLAGGGLGRHMTG